MADQELLSYLENFISEERKEKFTKILAQRTKMLTIAIEDVYQLHNTSAVIRSCESFGLQDAHVIEDRFGKRLDKNIAVGAQQWVDVYRYTTSSEALQTLKNKGYRIVATTPHDGSTALRHFEITGKTALFFGTEKEGLSKTVMERADAFLTIPMVGFTESLNISASAAIILHELSAQLRASKLNWHLTPQEIMEKQLDWTKKSIKSIDAILKRYGKGK